MTKKLLMAATCVAAMLLGSGVAYADPAPGPEPNGPKCWVTSDEGKQELTPCGWAYTDSRGWYQVPWGFRAM